LVNKSAREADRKRKEAGIIELRCIYVKREDRKKYKDHFKQINRLLKRGIDHEQIARKLAGIDLDI